MGIKKEGMGRPFCFLFFWTVLAFNFKTSKKKKGKNIYTLPSIPPLSLLPLIFYTFIGLEGGRTSYKILRGVVVKFFFFFDNLRTEGDLNFKRPH